MKKMKTDFLNAGKKYNNHNFKDFLEDEFFICSMKHPREETDFFWENEKNMPGFNREDFETARLFIQSVRVEQKNSTDLELVDLWHKTTIRNRKLKKYRNHLFYYTAAASVAIFIISLVFFNNIRNKNLSPDIIAIANVMEKAGVSDQVSLFLSNEREIAIAENNAEIQYSSQGEIQINSQLVEENVSEEKEEIKYNQLIVPHGKRTVLTLSDGSRLWVNAGTRVVYPLMFEKENREIFVDGEVFLDVKNRGNSPFTVKTNGISVQVTGTSFNVMAYKDEEIQSVVLVDGKVEVKSSGSKFTLNPNEMFESNDGNKSVKKVDVTDYILWKEGIYVFKSEKLSTIMASLSRYYGKPIECDELSSTFICNGKLDLKEDLERVLSGISKTAPVHWIRQDGKYLFNANQ